MASVYRTVMRGSGITAAMATAAWAVAAGMSLSDGPGGIEVPRWTSTAGVMVIVCGTVIGAGAWIVETSHRIAAEKNIRTVVREELDRALADAMPLLVATIVEAVTRTAAEAAGRFGNRVDGQLHRVAVLAAHQTAARVREAHTADLTEVCAGLHRKTLIAGMQLQADATGEEIGKTALRSVKTYVSTSRGD